MAKNGYITAANSTAILLCEMELGKNDKKKFAAVKVRADDGEKVYAFSLMELAKLGVAIDKILADAVSDKKKKK